MFTKIPETDLRDGIRIRRTEDEYTAELEIAAERPGAAKADAIECVERFLSILAGWNHGFQIRIGSVRAELIASQGQTAASEVSPGVMAITASDTAFAEDHIEAVVGKVNLDAEDSLLQRYADIPEYLRSCLDLNYLLVLSKRPPNRWFLAATGLEALAIGSIGAQETVSGRLTTQRRADLQAALGPIVEAAGIGDLAERVFQRVMSTSSGSVADLVYRYLREIGIADTSPEEIKRWWRVRGSIAHGGSVSIELGDLNHLIAVY